MNKTGGAQSGEVRKYAHHRGRPQNDEQIPAERLAEIRDRYFIFGNRIRRHPEGGDRKGVLAMNRDTGQYVLYTARGTICGLPQDFGREEVEIWLKTERRKKARLKAEERLRESAESEERREAGEAVEAPAFSGGGNGSLGEFVERAFRDGRICVLIDSMDGYTSCGCGDVRLTDEGVWRWRAALEMEILCEQGDTAVVKCDSEYDLWVFEQFCEAVSKCEHMAKQYGRWFTKKAKTGEKAQ